MFSLHPLLKPSQYQHYHKQATITVLITALFLLEPLLSAGKSLLHLQQSLQHTCSHQELPLQPCWSPLSSSHSINSWPNRIPRCRADWEPTWGEACPGTSSPCHPRQGQRAIPCLALVSWPCLITSEVSLDDCDFLLEDTEAPAVEKASEIPLEGNNGPALPLVPSSLQQLPGLLLQKDLRQREESLTHDESSQFLQEAINTKSFCFPSLQVSLYCP